MTSFSTRSSLVFAMALTSLGAFGATACGAEDPTPGSDASEVENPGQIGLNLAIGPDVTLNRVSYQIVGNGFTKGGSIDVSQSNTLTALIGGIPEGTGYFISLQGVDATNPMITTCNGSAVFDVTAGQTSAVPVSFLCTLPDGNGSIIVTGTGNVCPRIDGVSATPSETNVGSALSLAGLVTDSDRFPAAVTLAWSSTGGLLDDPTIAAPTFTCTAPGTFTVTLVATDSECSDAQSVSVTCSQP